MTWAWKQWSLEDNDAKAALALAMSLRRAPMGILFLPDADDGTMRVALTLGFDGDASALLDAPATVMSHVDRACGQHRRLTIRDVRADGADGVQPIRELAAALRFRGMEVLPLEHHTTPEHGNGRALGALALMFRSPLRLSPRSERLVDLATMLISLAFDNARLRADERRLREAAEQRAYDRLQFLARINHELRTPLQSITGYVELLGHTGDPPTPRQREILNHIEDSERILLNIIDSVASLGRLEAGRMTYDISGVTVVDVLARVASVVSPLAQKQKVTLQVDMPPRELLARGDYGKIIQILINLVTNAIKFTPAGGTVTLTTSRVGPRIDFIVKDEGPGIPPDKLAAIFEPWVQFDQRRNYPLAGYGLGLTISRELAAGMGGALSVANATPPDMGALFTFSVRIHRAERAAWRSRRSPPPFDAAQTLAPEPPPSTEPPSAEPLSTEPASTAQPTSTAPPPS